MTLLKLDFVDSVEIIDRLAEVLKFNDYYVSDEFSDGDNLDIYVKWKDRYGKFNELGLVELYLKDEFVATYEVAYEGMEAVIKFKDKDAVNKISRYLIEIKDYSHNFSDLDYL